MQELISLFYYRILRMANNDFDWIMESIRILPAIEELKSLVTCPKVLVIVENMITYLDDDYVLWDFYSVDDFDGDREIDKQKRDKNFRQLQLSFNEFIYE